MSQKTRMADIAEKAGVSIVTVSKALSGKPGVGDEMRKKIETIAREIGYKKQKGLNIGTGNIGILLCENLLTSADKGYWALYQNLLAYLDKNGYFCMLEVIKPNSPVPRMITEKKTDGAFVLGEIGKSLENELAKQGLPFVRVGAFNAEGIPSVITDGYYGMYALTKYLSDIGHKKIYFSGDASAHPSVNDRFYGYCRAMSEIGSAVSQDMVLMMSAGKPVLPAVMPTAFVCANSSLAGILSEVLKSGGYIIPRDISIAAYEEYAQETPNTALTLTVYRIDITKYAETAANALLERISNPAATPFLRVVSGTLIKNETTEPFTG